MYLRASSTWKSLEFLARRIMNNLTKYNAIKSGGFRKCSSSQVRVKIQLDSIVFVQIGDIQYPLAVSKSFCVYGSRRVEQVKFISCMYD